MSNLEPHPSLPARPPQSSTYSAPPRHNNAGARPFPASTPAFSAGFMPRSVTTRVTAPQSSTPVQAPTMTTQASYYGGGYPNVNPTSSAYYPQQHPAYGTSTPSIVANPYQAPGAGTRGLGRTGVYDAEEEARIAEWNSAYTLKDDSAKKGNANATVLGSRPSEASGTPDLDAGPGVNKDKGKQKTVVRQGGGKSWEDPSLLEWDPLHPRLFVGNLAGEVTDDSLLKAFSKYPSVSKARVVRDKKSTKSKSYGFVSFANTDDYFRAAREMEGKYIGSHPVRIKRANTDFNVTTKRDDKHGKHGKKNNNNHKKGGGAGAGVSNTATLGATGVQKHSHKKGPKILG